MKSDMPTASEWLLGIAVLVALIFLINPFNILMTSAFTLTLIMVLAATVIGFAVFVWREQPRDEREALYSLKAGHISYFIGGGVLVTAIIVQAIQHDLDQWLAVALGAMVLTKLLVSAWARRR
jgi:amino acid transporter